MIQSPRIKRVVCHVLSGLMIVVGGSKASLIVHASESTIMPFPILIGIGILECVIGIWILFDGSRVPLWFGLGLGTGGLIFLAIINVMGLGGRTAVVSAPLMLEWSTMP